MLSNNDLLINKLHYYVDKTQFLELLPKSEFQNEYEFPVFMFYDIDSVNIQNAKYVLSQSFCPIFISSLYTRDVVEKMLGTEFSNIGYLSKLSNYEDFIEEVSQLIDNSIS